MTIDPSQLRRNAEYIEQSGNMTVRDYQAVHDYRGVADALEAQTKRIVELEADRDAWMVKAEEALALLRKANDQCEGWAATATRQTEVISDLRTKAERIAELEAALLVRLDRKVLNDTWRNRAEKAESDLIVANDRIAELESEVTQWEIDHAPIGLSDAIDKRAADVEAELRSDLAVARKALLDHHKWHTHVGEVFFFDDGEQTYVSVDLSREYADSSLYENCAAAIAAAQDASVTVRENSQ